ncbi:MAG: SEC59/DGK1/VTE5 family protein [Methanomassiliicoccales archaeon]
MLGRGDVIGLLLVYCYVASIVAISQHIRKRYGGDAQRKFIHMATGNIVLFWWVFDQAWVMAFLAAAPFVPILLLVSPYSPIPKLRNSVLGRTTGAGHGLGLVMYAISWTILAFIFFDNRAIASIGIVAMAYGDGFGGFVGRRYGRRKLLYGKSLEGSISVFIATSVATLAVLSYYDYLFTNSMFTVAMPSVIPSIGISLGIGAFVALVELITPGDIDNIVIPILTSCVVYFTGI